MFIVRRFVYNIDFDAALSVAVVGCLDLDEVKHYMDATFTKDTSYSVEWEDD